MKSLVTTPVRSLLAGIALLCGASASAAPIFTIDGGLSIVDVGNDFLWIDSEITEGGALQLSEPGFVTVEYIGKEAGFAATEFWFGALTSPGGTLVATTNVAPPFIEGQTAADSLPPPGIARGLAPYLSPMIGAGTVPFYFRVPDDGDAIVENGHVATAEAPADVGFWWPSGPRSLGSEVYVLLDDGGGVTPGEPSDNDHDDMIVRLTVSAIPEPGTLAMLMTGLALLERRARRQLRRRAALRCSASSPSPSSDSVVGSGIGVTSA
jgi:hypothetical protein